MSEYLEQIEMSFPRTKKRERAIWPVIPLYVLTADIWWLLYGNFHIVIYLSYMFFSFWQVCLFDVVRGVKGKTAECSECGDMGFLPGQKSRITHVTWWYGFICSGKKAVSPTWPIITPFALHKSDMCLKAIKYHICKTNIFSSKCMVILFVIWQCCYSVA